MQAVLFCAVLFCCWAAIGHAFLACVPARIAPRQRGLLAPTMGAAAVILPVFWLNRLGLAVESFAMPLLALLAVSAAAVLAWKRPSIRWRGMLPFIAILLAALLLAGWPMLLYGFDWVSYGNGDMTHYSLGAARVLHGGFFAPPDQDAVLRGTDFAIYNANQYILTDGRAGSELMLAAIWGATGLDAHRIFMPMTMALHLALVCASAAMVAGPRSPRGTAPLVALLVSLSPLTTLGALSQLIAQVGGLAFFCASVVLLYRIPLRGTPLRMLAGSIPAAVVSAALFIWYPEILPFLGLAWLAFIVLIAPRGLERARRTVVHGMAAGLLVLALLNSYALSAVKFMFGQAQYAMGQAALGGAANPIVLQSADAAPSAFPYFLTPSGFPIFWGIVPFAGLDITAYLAAAVIFAVALSLWFLWGVRSSLRRASPAAVVFLVMAGLGVVLFRSGKDFGLFKLAMFAQPFVLALVAERLVARGPGFVARGAGYALMGAAALTAIASQFAYVRLSTGEYLGGLAEIWHGSSSRINTAFAQVIKDLEAKSPAGFTSDTSNVVELQHQTLYSRGYSAFYPGFSSYGIYESWRYPLVEKRMPHSRAIALAGKETSAVLPQNLKEELARRWFVTIPRYDTIFNTFLSDPRSTDYFRVGPPESVSDHLIFVPSQMGEHYYFFSTGLPVAFNHLENDPMFPGRQSSGLGRDLLFMVMNPSTKPRVVMEISATVMPQFDRLLPQAMVRGALATPVGFVGRGSGRVASPPLEPGYIEGVPFLAIDMGRAPKLAPHEPKGVMRLFGAQINPDPRSLTAYARDISLLSGEGYAALVPPSELRNFPADLGNRNLEYSGIYEDGWISEAAFFVLGAAASANRLRIAGMVPRIADPGFTTTLTIRIDGASASSRELKLGEFSVEVPLPASAPGKRRIELAFSKLQNLPGGDGRPTAAHISYLGLEAAR